MRYTPFAGLTALDENDPITIDGSSFLIKNPKITDQLLRVGAISHRHDNHIGLVNPQAGLTGQVVPSGGTLSASSSFAVTYTVLDKQGGETTMAPPVQLTTGVQVGPPTIAPQLTLVSSAGIMQAGNYYYALTYTDGEGGETTLGPQSIIQIPPGFASASVVCGNLAQELHVNGPVQWRLWRSYEGEDWHLVNQNSTGSYDDAGFDPPDNPARPPDSNTTASTYSLLITLPTADQEPAIASGTAINLYLAPDTSFNDPCFYLQVPLASAGHTLHITQYQIQTGSPPHVSTSVQGAGQIYPDTDMIWALKSPVANAQSLPSGSYGDMRVALDSQHIWAALTPFVSVPSDWTDLSAVAAAGGITIMGSGVGDAVWQTTAHEIFAGVGSGSFADFTNVGGANMKVASGLLTTTDPTQTDAVMGPLTGPGSQALQWATWATGRLAVVPQVTGFAGWPQGQDATLSRPPAVDVVTSWTAAGWAPGDGSNPPATAPVPTYVNPNYGSNQIGDTLTVEVATLQYCTSFWWNGAAWAPLFVDAQSGTGYSATNNFVPVLLKRGAAHHETIYGYQWTGPGQFADGFKLRARVHGIGHSVLGFEDGQAHPTVGLVLNMVNETQGLCFYVGGQGAGWTTRPQDIVFDQNNWPPAQQQPGLGVLYNVQYAEDLWIEVWRIGDKAYGAVYIQDPASGALPEYTSVFDAAGTAYAAGNAGYLGVVANHLADMEVGFEELTVQEATLLPTVALYNEHEVIFTGSGGVNVAVQRAASGIAQVVVSGGGIEIAGSGGVGVTGFEQYVEFAGSGGTGVAIQPMGGGSARVLISAPAGGGGGGSGVPGPQGPAGPAGAAGVELAGSAGANPTPFGPETYVEFVGSGGTGVAVQDIGGGSARVLIAAPAGGGSPSVFEDDAQQAVSLTNVSGFTALATPDRVTVTTASASDEIMVRYDALWTCDQGTSAFAAIFVDGVQCTMVTPNNATPQGQQATFTGGNGSWVPLYTLPMELATAGPTNTGLVSQTVVATPTSNTDNPFPGSTIAPGGPIILRGLAPGAHTIEIRFNSTYVGTQNVYAKRRHLRAWVT